MSSNQTFARGVASGKKGSEFDSAAQSADISKIAERYEKVDTTATEPERLSVKEDVHTTGSYQLCSNYPIGQTTSGPTADVTQPSFPVTLKAA